MQKNSTYTTANNLNPMFQQHTAKGRVQLHDLAFFMRKYAFMQQPAQVGCTEKKK